MKGAVYQVNAFWDEEAEVWVATSKDVPGLVTEVDTVEASSQKLRGVVPDLLVSNHVSSADYAGAIAVQVTGRAIVGLGLHLREKLLLKCH